MPTEQLLEKIKKEWPVIQANKLTFGTVALLCLIGGFTLGRAWDARQMGIMQARLDGGESRESTSKMHGAVIAIKEWILSPTQQTGELRLVGRFINIGDIDTTATMTTAVFVDGEEVTEPRDREPVQLDFATTMSKPNGWGDPFFIYTTVHIKR
jgi:hypothetical protein